MSNETTRLIQVLESTPQTQARNLALSRLKGSLNRMMALANELALTAEDLQGLPHHIADDIADGCIRDERSNGNEPRRDWHAFLRPEADEAVAGGLEGLIAYLLGHFYEISVAKILRNQAAHRQPFQPSGETRP